MTNLIKDLKILFQRMTPMQMAVDELAEAELSLLKAETGVEYATSLVMYNKARVKRLKSYIIGER